MVQQQSFIGHINGLIKVGFIGSSRIGMRVAWSAVLGVGRGIHFARVCLLVRTSPDAVASSDAGAEIGGVLEVPTSLLGSHAVASQLAALEPEATKPFKVLI
jgi:hypothetical protein